MDRMLRLRSTSTRASRILEIGPSHAPVAPKSAGWNTFVVDYATREELQEKYRDDAVDINAIEEVDGVWRGGSLDEVVPGHLHGTFDTLIASHVIEHLPDLAGFLASAEMLLRPGGSIVLAVPDRRFCFDYFKPATLTGDVLEAYVTKRSRHSPRTLWNQTAYSVAWDGAGAWGQDPIHEVKFTSDFDNARDRFVSFRDGLPNEYVDCHTWHFTPAGFALVILELAQLGIIDWRVESLEGPEGCEFFAVLRHGAERDRDMTRLQQQRMDLLRQQLAEMKQQLDLVLGAPQAEAVSAPAPADAVMPALTQIADMLRDQRSCLHAIQTTAEGVSEAHRLADALAKAEHAVAAQHQEVVALRAELAARNSELARTQDEAAQRSADLRFAQSRITSMTALCEQWQKDREIILGSRSWRISAPLRAAGRTLRAMSHGLRSRLITAQDGR